MIATVIPVLNKIFFVISRNIGWVIIILLLLGLLAYMTSVNGKLDFQAKYAQAAYHSTKQQLDGQSNILSQTKNELGQEQTKVTVLTGNEKVLKMLFKEQNQEFAKRLDELGIEMKDLKSVTNLKVTTSGQFVTVTRDTIVERFEEKMIGEEMITDTIREKLTLINYKEPNGWFTMSGSIHGDTMKFEPSFREEFDVVIADERMKKRFWWDLFPPKQTVGTVESKNPYSKTNEVKVIVKEKEKTKLFGIF